MDPLDQEAEQTGLKKTKRSPGALIEPLWGPQQVAQYLGVPVQTVYRWRSVGYGPASSKIGKHIRYIPSEVLSWVQARRSASGEVG